MIWIRASLQKISDIINTIDNENSYRRQRGNLWMDLVVRSRYKVLSDLRMKGLKVIYLKDKPESLLNLMSHL